MSQISYIPVPNDLTVPDTVYYETQYRIVGQPNYTQELTNSPLPLAVIVSPWAMVPYVILPPLPDATAYEFMMRRFDSNGNYSIWTTGTFNTP